VQVGPLLGLRSEVRRPDDRERRTLYTLTTASGIGLAAALLLWVAIANGFPLCHSDTGTYVDSSFTWRVPPDRPVFYGLFLAVTHARETLWAPVIVQAAIAAIGIHLLLRLLTPTYGVTATVLVVTLLAATTSLPWFVGQLSPDFFAGVLVVSFYLVIAGADHLGRAARRFAVACLVLSVVVHSSHILLATILAGVVQLQAQWMRPPPWRHAGVRRVWRALAAAVVVMLVGNLLLSGKLTLAGGAHAFLMGRLIEDGVMQRVLDEQCPTTPYRLCAFRSQLPMSADDYLWPADGLLKQTGSWRGSRAESWQLILRAVATHPLLITAGALRASARQLGRFRTGEGLGPLAAGSWVDTVIARRFPHEYDRFVESRQQQGTLPIDTAATVGQRIAIVAGLLAVMLAIGHVPTAPWSPFAGLVVTALLGNAVVTGTLSEVHDRYQSRLIWLVVLAALLGVLRRFERHVTRDHDELPVLSDSV